jgi:hypothetical protein
MENAERNPSGMSSLLVVVGVVALYILLQFVILPQFGLG